MSIISERMRKSRIEAGYSLEELASLSGIGRASLQRYETGTSEPTVDKVYGIAKALNIPFGYLLGFESRIISDKDLEFLNYIFDYLNLGYVYSADDDFYYFYPFEEEEQFDITDPDSDYILEHIYLIKNKFIVYPDDLKKIREELFSYGTFKLFELQATDLFKHDFNGK